MLSNIHIAVRSIPARELEQQMQASMIAPPLYTWVTDDAGQIQWLTEALIKANNAPESITKSTWCNRDYVIGLFDLLGTKPRTGIDARDINNYLKESINNKKKVVLHLRGEWENFCQPNKILEWFNKNDEPIRLKAALETFKKLYPHFSSMFFDFKNFEELLDTFERNQIPITERAAFLSAAKIKCSQMKSREKNKGKKKQCNVDLSLPTMSKLKQMAAKYDLSHAAIIEILIKKEHEKNLYIPARLKQISGDH